MAKRTMDWSVNEDGVLNCDHLDNEGKVLKAQTFDITKLFPDYSELDEIQQKLVVYGLKQKLADSVAAEKKLELTCNERIVTLDGIFARLLDGVWSQKGGGVRNTLKKQMQEGMDSLDDETKAAIPEAVAEMMKKYGIKL